MRCSRPAVLGGRGLSTSPEKKAGRRWMFRPWMDNFLGTLGFFFFFSSFRFLLVGNALIETFGGEKMGENVCLGGEK